MTCFVGFFFLLLLPHSLTLHQSDIDGYAARLYYVSFVCNLHAHMICSMWMGDDLADSVCCCCHWRCYCCCCYFVHATHLLVTSLLRACLYVCLVIFACLPPTKNIRANRTRFCIHDSRTRMAVVWNTHTHTHTRAPKIASISISINWTYKAVLLN